MQQLTLSKEYVHPASAGNIEKCRRIATMIKQKLSESFANKEIEGWETLIIKNEEDLDAYFILTNPCKVAGNKFPFLFLAVQHYQTENLNITKLINENGFVGVFE
ncbi:MAG: hypothetical protein P1P88_12995 [Bacteroidales bacterium]|nr:hypothetical protein [Bacteroidales bacterium]